MNNLHDNVGLTLFFTLGFFVCLLFGLIVSWSFEPHQAIVDKGCAQYNPKTSEFEWIKSKEKGK